MAKEETKKTEVGFLDEHAGEGFDQITAEDFTIPFLRILQILSPQVDDDRTEFIQGAKPGMFFNTVTGRLYGTTIKVIPLMYKKLWLEWLPNRGGLVGRHEPKSVPVDKSEFSKWHNEKGNLIAEHHVFYCLIDGHIEDGPVVFSLSSTGIKHARNWNTQLMMVRLPSGGRAPFFSSVWEMETVKNVNQQGTWYQIGDKKTMLKRIRFVTQEEYTQYILPNKESLESLKEMDFSQLEDQQRDVTEETGETEEGSAPY